MIRQQIEAADVKEDELERQIEDREYGLPMRQPAAALQKPPVYQPQAAQTYAAPTSAYSSPAAGTSYPSPTTQT